MQATATTATLPIASVAHREDHLRHLPAGARDAYLKFQAGGNPAALNAVILAILRDYSPRRSAIPLADLPGSTRLVDDLGFDSLAITEVVFAAEDLFRISITNGEIIQVRTLDDLQGFIQAKIAASSAR